MKISNPFLKIKHTTSTIKVKASKKSINDFSVYDSMKFFGMAFKEMSSSLLININHKCHVNSKENKGQ